MSSFGGEQFKLPDQKRQLETFFHLFYFLINFGSLLSTIITPIARDDVHCYEEPNCYSLAFFIPAVLMVASLAIFIAGTPLYNIKKTSGHSLVDVIRTIWVGFLQTSSKTLIMISFHHRMHSLEESHVTKVKNQSHIGSSMLTLSTIMSPFGMPKSY